MPFRDGTGPRGQGPMSGAGRGGCARALQAGWAEGGVGRAGAFGWGRGRSCRYGYRATGLPVWAGAGRGRLAAPGYSEGTPQDELEYLRDYIQGLEEALNATRARVVELEQAKKAE